MNEVAVGGGCERGARGERVRESLTYGAFLGGVAEWLLHRTKFSNEI